ncbi:hypothetical protein K443DRAFT_408473 [Laccaria amethystina LaAM-08-1]|uniref:Uncharacterized protein n=1 Tax=Laccaria amethystina LaAM-08-1 TaxID=1095629 RepID=A0A0C9WWH2_9AGAR|nr:hypothetical protein K443DRAFT_408473 [Laccaria amethystina LaAM-08-1]
MSDSAGVALLTDQYPGSTGDEPMAFVCLNPVNTWPAFKPLEVKTQVQLRVRRTFAALYDTPAWLPIVEGEILFSNGIKIMKKDYTNSMSFCNN